MVEEGISIDRVKLRRAYARLKGLERAMPTVPTVRAALIQDFNDLVESLTEVLGENMSDFSVRLEPRSGMSSYGYTEDFKSKLYQLLSLLEHSYHVASEIIEIGSLYNSIRDEELKARCADLLSAPGNFDRVINQATLVLEDRIRKKSRDDSGRPGLQLVNHVISGDPTKTILKLSDEADEQRGYADICRGIMAAFRNPTHHHVSDKFSREDALKVCAFIDDLLKVIDGAAVIKKS